MRWYTYDSHCCVTLFDLIENDDAVLVLAQVCVYRTINCFKAKTCFVSTQNICPIGFTSYRSYSL